MKHRVYVGTAAWAIPRACAPAFEGEGSVLARYARVFDTVEINSTFYRVHRPATFARWRDTVPSTFRFAVKLARTITHEARLESPAVALRAFFEGTRELGSRMGPLLVQLAPGHAFERRRATTFFRILRELHDGPVAFEPRHVSWFGPDATTLLTAASISRVEADPPQPANLAAEPAGEPSLRYLRLHGSPRMYWSSYADGRIESIATRIEPARDRATVYCIFDNTAAGAACSDALLLRSQLTSR